MALGSTLRGISQATRMPRSERGRRTLNSFPCPRERTDYAAPSALLAGGCRFVRHPDQIANAGPHHLGGQCGFGQEVEGARKNIVLFRAGHQEHAAAALLITGRVASAGQLCVQARIDQ